MHLGGVGYKNTPNHITQIGAQCGESRLGEAYSGAQLHAYSNSILSSLPHGTHSLTRRKLTHGFKRSLVPRRMRTACSRPYFDNYRVGTYVEKSRLFYRMATCDQGNLVQLSKLILGCFHSVPIYLRQSVSYLGLVEHSVLISHTPSVHCRRHILMARKVCPEHVTAGLAEFPLISRFRGELDLQPNLIDFTCFTHRARACLHVVSGTHRHSHHA